MLSAPARSTARTRTRCPRRAMAVAATMMAVSPRAVAQDKATCNAAYERADLLVHGSDADKLIEARESLRTCAGTSCQAWMIKDCTQWLSDLERRVPSVVLLAKDARGRDVTAVTVSVDKQVLTRKLDGRAIELNPGERTFVFEGPQGRRIERRALVREGEKDQVVQVTFDDSHGMTEASSAADARGRPDVRLGSSATSPSPPPARTPEPGSGARFAETPTRQTGLPWRTLGYAVGGMGAAAVTIGSILGVMAISNNSASNANGHCTGGCDPEGASLRYRAIDEASASTVAFAIGAGLLLPGVSLLLFAPSESTRGALRGPPRTPQENGSGFLRWSPVVSSNITGMALSGEF